MNNVIKYAHYDAERVEYKNEIESIQWKQECLHSDRITEISFIKSHNVPRWPLGIS